MDVKVEIGLLRPLSDEWFIAVSEDPARWLCESGRDPRKDGAAAAAQAAIDSPEDRAYFVAMADLIRARRADASAGVIAGIEARLKALEYPGR